MASYSQFLSHKILNWLRGTALGTTPDTYMGLFDGTSEVTTNVRAAGRVQVNFGAPADDAGGRAITLPGEVNYGEADQTQEVDGLRVFDAASAGNNLLLGMLAAPKTAVEDKVFKLKDVKFNTTGDLAPHTKDVVLDWLRGDASAAAPSTVYLALYNDNTEVTTQVRAAGRLAITFGNPAGKEMLSDVLADFGQSANAVSVTHGALFTAASAGTMLAKALINGATVQDPIAIDAGDEVVFEIGDVKVQVL
jgi:hypothetical protein